MANVEKLRELAMAIERRDKEPKLPKEKLAQPLPRFKMTKWATFNKRAKHVPPMCKTAGCVAGSAVALFHPEQYLEIVGRVLQRRRSQNSGADDNLVTQDIGDVAATALELRLDQQFSLFGPCIPQERVKAHHAVTMLHWLADHPTVSGWEIDRQWEKVVLLGES